MVAARASDPVGFVAAHLTTSAQAPSIAEVVRHAEHSSAAAAPSDWDAAKFLADGVAASVAAALLKPLQPSGGGATPPGQQALAFVKALGTAPDRRACVRALLLAGLDELTDGVVAAAEGLSEGSAASAAELSSKFAAETFTLSYSSLSAFFSGLEGRVGPPSPALRAAMYAPLWAANPRLADWTYLPLTRSRSNPAQGARALREPRQP